MGLLTGALCAIVLVWLLVWLIVALWVRGDARRQGRNPLIWFLVVFLLGLIGLLLYWATGALRPTRRPGRQRGAGEGGKARGRA